jgi:outer membrane immunogenic protein
MKKLLLASAAFIVMSAPVLAADMPVKAPRPVAPAFAWTGCYKGINVGYAWANFEKSSVVETPLPPSPFRTFFDFDYDGDYAIGGEQIGCNWQTGFWVWGVEADISITSIEARHYFDNAIFDVPNAAFDTDVRSALRWLGTVRGRLGWTVTPETFIYLTGGLAYGHVSSSLSFHSSAGAYLGRIGFDSNHHWGYVVGIGAEAKVARNFSAKIEYLYADLGSQTYDFAVSTTSAASVFSWDQRVDVHIVRVGLNYQWDWGYPVGAWGVGKGKGKAPAPVVTK